MGETVFEATHIGYLEIAGKKLRCAVLSNGKRIITQTALFDAFDRPRKGEKRLENLPSIIGAKNLEKFVDAELIEKSQEIKYRHTNGTVAGGYDADVIPLICELYIQAKDDNELHPSQENQYIKSMILIRALAKVGITALIDEATGYQYDRDSQELQKLLEAYISQDLMKWQKRFPMTYYREIYRLYNWPFDPSSTKHTQYVGVFTNDYVYDLFPDEVMDEIKRKNPVVKKGDKVFRKHKFHQFFTSDIGVPQLDSHLNQLLPVMKLSDNIQEFKKNFNRVFAEQIELKRKQAEEDKQA
jgi:hypothetical protein